MFVGDYLCVSVSLSPFFTLLSFFGKTTFPHQKKRCVVKRKSGGGACCTTPSIDGYTIIVHSSPALLFEGVFTSLPPFSFLFSPHRFSLSVMSARPLCVVLLFWSKPPLLKRKNMHGAFLAARLVSSKAHTHTHSLNKRGRCFFRTGYTKTFFRKAAILFKREGASRTVVLFILSLSPCTAPKQHQHREQSM